MLDIAVNVVKSAFNLCETFDMLMELKDLIF